MSKYSETCLDANLVIRAVAGSASAEVKRLWREWLNDKVMLHAPTLLRYEVVNALHQIRKAGLLEPADADRALADALSRPIVLHADEDLHTRAMRLAAEHQLPAAYDAHYLALAERLDVELWTGDAHLVKAVGDRLAWVRLVS